MSFSVDVNLLVYASDRGSPYHVAARAFLEERAAGREIFCIAWATAMSYLRIVTHPGILASPLHPTEALANLGAIAAGSAGRSSKDQARAMTSRLASC